jgi:hypothetical protein
MSLKVIILVDRGSSSKERKPGALIAFPYHRMTVERFCEAFPRARWSDDKRAWFVPGKTAARRLDHWLAREADQALPHADAKGRDAYEFEPITSTYLEAADDLRVRTPYSGVLFRVKELVNGISIVPALPALQEKIEYLQIVLDP